MVVRYMTAKINIHQTACYHYLRQIQIFYINSHLTAKKESPYRELFSALNSINDQVNDNPKNTVDYAKLYTEFQKAAENVAKFEISDKKIKKNNNELDDLFLTIFENDNKMNKIIFEAFNSEKMNVTAEEINKSLKVESANTNTLNPHHPDNRANAFFTSMMGWFNYNPLQKNNVPYVNPDIGPQSNQPKNLRFGAQTQNKGEVNAVFKRYLLANARRSVDDDNNYQYVYFNLLKREQSNPVSRKYDFNFKDKFVRSSEGYRGSALESLNFDKELKVAVITLPADNNFLLKNFNVNEGRETAVTTEPVDTLFKELATSILFKKNDFYIHKKFYKQIFGEDANNIFLNRKNHHDLTDDELQALMQTELGELFKSAVEEITGKNLDNAQPLSTLERSAVLFHFVKFSLTDHILDKLNPQGYNTTCKDAIDRGAVHTLWYQMNKQFKMHLEFEEIKPMSEKEFLMYLESPAMSVKYRALNHNRNQLWNVLNHRMKADPIFASLHPWAQNWLIQNDPQAHNKQTKRTSYILSQQKPTDSSATKQDKKLIKPSALEKDEKKGRPSIKGR